MVIAKYVNNHCAFRLARSEGRDKVLFGCVFSKCSSLAPFFQGFLIPPLKSMESFSACLISLIRAFLIQTLIPNAHLIWKTRDIYLFLEDKMA